MTIDELPWRCQANLVLASCYLNQVLNRLRSGVGESAEHEEAEEEEEESGAMIDGLRFDSTGMIIEGVVPVFQTVVPGRLNKVH